MSFIRVHQLSIMLFMSGICGILSFMTLMTDSLSRGRKSILALMELAAMLLLLADRACYQYRGDVSELGFFVVWVCNGMVFFLSVFIPHLVTQYLRDVLRDEGGLTAVPASLRICDGLFLTGTALIVISQFTGLYYTIDRLNLYHRSQGYVLSYIVPLLIVALQGVTLLKYRARLGGGLVRSLLVSITLPTLASVAQIFCYGVSLTNMTMVLMVIAFYLYALRDMGRKLRLARLHEIESYRQARQTEAAMFEQTAEALANAIDAKDRYTHGHSKSVAAFSRLIAREAGLSEEDCKLVYFAALLHDVGKIGVRDEIINKVGRLTDAEYEQIKQHPILGAQILSCIRQSPQLSVSARHHHERFDGTGYPDGLRGGDIPEIARIIAVADAYDAMTSSRSYRSPLSAQKTWEEVLRGMGTQFDPRFAQILLELIDRGKVRPDGVVPDKIE